MNSNGFVINIMLDFAIIENSFIKNKLINLGFNETDEFMKIKTNHLFILDDSNIIFHKIFSPRCNYIPKKYIDSFLYNEERLYFKEIEEDLSGEEFMVFKKNNLIFNNLICSGNYDCLQNTIFKLSDSQIIDFKKEFEKLYLISENNITDNINYLYI